MIEKIVTFCLVLHFAMETFVVVANFLIRHKLKKSTSISITIRGAGAGLAIAILAVVSEWAARHYGWDLLSSTLGILVIPYVFFAIYLTSNSINLKEIREDADKFVARK